MEGTNTRLSYQELIQVANRASKIVKKRLGYEVFVGFAESNPIILEALNLPEGRENLNGLREKYQIAKLETIIRGVEKVIEKIDEKRAGINGECPGLDRAIGELKGYYNALKTHVKQDEN